MPSPLPEVWLRGPVPGVAPALQPVAHALLQAREDVERLALPLTPEELWQMPGGAASIGFHLRHMAGSLDRLLTYARGEALTEAQRAALAVEKDVTPEVDAGALVAEVHAAIDRALEQVRRTPEAALDAPRAVGRAGLPSTVRGLLAHAAEHTARHAGQISTTVRVVRGLAASPR
ncbi:MAG TPA: DinB family protein [Rubricoccaceae bacterium]|nr:DinB family protein [Rubricoccaceae bacterium]